MAFTRRSRFQGGQKGNSRQLCDLCALCDFALKSFDFEFFDKLLSMGKSDQGRVLIVAYAEKSENHVRIISARCATRKELKKYEQIH